MKENQPVLDEHRLIEKDQLLAKAKKAIQELQVVENLSVYTKAYKTISKSGAPGRRGHYSLILLNSRENTISLEAYSVNQFAEAAQKYLELETRHFEDRQINVVLVNTGDLKKLEASYPNYFMDTNELIQNISLITMGKFL